MEKREELTLGLKVRSPDQHISFIFKLLKDIEDFANYSTKKFYQARYTSTCLNYDPDDEEDTDDEQHYENSEDSDASCEDPEDQVDLQAFLEECRLEEEEERRALVVPREEEECRDAGHSFYFY